MISIWRTFTKSSCWNRCSDIAATGGGGGLAPRHLPVRSCAHKNLCLWQEQIQSCYLPLWLQKSSAVKWGGICFFGGGCLQPNRILWLKTPVHRKCPAHKAIDRSISLQWPNRLAVVAELRLLYPGLHHLFSLLYLGDSNVCILNMSYVNFFQLWAYNAHIRDVLSSNWNEKITCWHEDLEGFFLSPILDLALKPWEVVQSIWFL